MRNPTHRLAKLSITVSYKIKHKQEHYESPHQYFNINKRGQKPFVMLFMLNNLFLRPRGGGGGRGEGGGNGKKRVTQQKNRLTVWMLWAGEGESFVFEYTRTIRNLQIILNTQKIPSRHPKKYLLNFPNQENPGIKNFKPKKSFDHPCHLEFRVSPTRLNRNQLNMDTLLLLRVCIVLREGLSLTHVSLNSSSLIRTPC